MTPLAHHHAPRMRQDAWTEMRRQWKEVPDEIKELLIMQDEEDRWMPDDEEGDEDDTH